MDVNFYGQFFVDVPCWYHDLTVSDASLPGYLYCVRHAYDQLCRNKGVLVAVTSFSGEVRLIATFSCCGLQIFMWTYLYCLYHRWDSHTEQRIARRNLPSLAFSSRCDLKWLLSPLVRVSAVIFRLEWSCNEKTIHTESGTD